MIHRQIPICLFVSNYHPAEQKGLGPRLLCHFSTKNKARQFYQNYRAFLVEARGVDLPCGAGRVAALECPRHSIHSRSRSTPRVGLTKSKKLPPYGESFSLLVEARGVEPLSENASKGTSPGADAYFGIAPVFLRHRSNVKPAGRVASLCMVRSKLCALTSASDRRPASGPRHSRRGRVTA